MFKCIDLKSYKSTYNFSANAGELTVILGLNGCGKTTLLKHLCGIIKTTGKVMIGESDILCVNPRERSRKIAYLPQKTVNFNELNVKNFTLTARTPYINLLSNPSKNDIIIVENMLKLCGVYEFLDRKINSLSGGELKRVEVAKILAQQTDVLILDEPTAHLDFKSSYQMVELIANYTKSNQKSTIMTLHDPNLALKFADKIIVLNEQGILAEINDRNDTKNIEKILKTIYGSDFDLINGQILAKS